MIPTRIFFQIHDSRRLLMTCSLNEFLIGYFDAFCVVFFGCSNFCFHPELYRFLDYCFSVSLSFVLVRYGVFQLLLNIKHQRRCRNKRTISPECTNPAFPWSNAINSYVYFVALFPEARYSWFPSRSTNIHDSPLLKTKIHDSHKFCNYDSWFMIHDSASTPENWKRYSQEEFCKDWSNNVK